MKKSSVKLNFYKKKPNGNSDRGRGETTNGNVFNNRTDKFSNLRSEATEAPVEEQEIFQAPISKFKQSFPTQSARGAPMKPESPRQSAIPFENKERRGSGEMSLESQRVSSQDSRPKFDFNRNNERQRNIGEKEKPQEGRRYNQGSFNKSEESSGQPVGNSSNFYNNRFKNNQGSEPIMNQNQGGQRRGPLEDNFFSNRNSYQSAGEGLKHDTVVLMVAEKPSIARSIVESLAPGGNFKTRRGLF